MNPTRCTINRGPWLPPAVLSSNCDLPDPVPVSTAEPVSNVVSNVATPPPAPRPADVSAIRAASKSDELSPTESHSCTKSRGEGVEPSKNLLESAMGAPTSQPTDAPSDPVLCSHVSPAGRRCRMLPAKDHPSLCAHHARKSRRRQQPDDEALAAELLDSIDDFTSADSVNLFLGNLVKQLARKRIERRDAIALAYLSQLLLNSLAAMEEEILNQLPLEPVYWPRPTPSEDDRSEGSAHEV
jgi:hypothetical protein